MRAPAEDRPRRGRADSWVTGAHAGWWACDRLPETLEAQVWQTIRQDEQDQHMTVITTAERSGIEKGRAER